MNESIPPTWWEKTVEYNFVLQAQKEKMANFFAPLDGNVEQIGDAVIGSDSKFYIVEFKKALSLESSEYEKYNDGKDGYERAKAACMGINHGRHHLIIGGKLCNSGKTLELEIRPYFDGEETPSNSIIESLTNGVTQDKLDSYILALINERAEEDRRLGDGDGDGDGDGGGGGGGGTTFANVVAISENGVSSINLEYYRLKRKLTLTTKPTKKPTKKNTL